MEELPFLVNWPGTHGKKVQGMVSRSQSHLCLFKELLLRLHEENTRVGPNLQQVFRPTSGVSAYINAAINVQTACGKG